MKGSLGKMKEFHVQLVKVNKNNRNESNLSKFLNSRFFVAMAKPVPMGNTLLQLVGRENVSLTPKKRDSLYRKVSFRYRLEKKLFTGGLFLY